MAMMDSEDEDMEFEEEERDGISANEDDIDEGGEE